MSARVRLGRTPVLGTELRAVLDRGRLAQRLHLRLRAHDRRGHHGRGPRRGGPDRRLGAAGRHRCARVPGPGHRGQGEGRSSSGRRPALDHLPGRPATGQVGGGRIRTGVHRRHRGIGPGVGLLHDRVPDRGIQCQLGIPDAGLGDRTDVPGPHGRPPTGPPTAALGTRRRLAPRGLDDHHRTGAGPRRCRAPVHHAGEPGAPVQEVRPDAPRRGRRCGSCDPRRRPRSRRPTRSIWPRRCATPRPT